MKLAVAGAGKLGSCLAAVLGSAGHEVTVVDPYAPGHVAAINRLEPPVREPRLAELLATGTVRATDSFQEAAEGAQASYVVVPTPSTPWGTFDASAVHEAAKEIAGVADPGHVLVVVSTVSPGTVAGVEAAAGLPVVYAPAFVALGSVVDDLRSPDMVLVGADDDRAGALVAEVARSFATTAPVVTMSVAEAEVTKLALNAALVARISFANAVAEACEHHPGVDARVVLGAVGLDHRVGPMFMTPAGPAAGPCLPRDSLALAAWLGEHEGPTDLAVAAHAVNERQYRRLAAAFDDHDRVAVLGLAYKAGTPVTDRSLGLAVAETLQWAGKEVWCHDPVATPPHVRLCGSPLEAVAEADAVLVATAAADYWTLDVGGRFTVDVWGVLPEQPGVRVVGRDALR